MLAQFLSGWIKLYPSAENDMDFLRESFRENFGWRFFTCFNLSLDVQVHLPTQTPFIFSFFLLHFKGSQAKFSNNFQVIKTQMSISWEVIVQTNQNLGVTSLYALIAITFSKGKSKFASCATIVIYLLSSPFPFIFIGKKRVFTFICCGKKNFDLIWFELSHQAFLDVDIRIPESQLTGAVENAGARVNGLLAALKAIILVENVVESTKVSIQIWQLDDHLASLSLRWACTWWATWAPWWPAWPWSPSPGSASSPCQGSTRTTRPRLTRRSCLCCE